MWRDWPETPWDAANVLCEGPSILDLDPTELLLGPIIAVNHALAVEAPVDFWATSDSPRTLWAWSERHRRSGLRYFTTDQNVGAWQELLGDEVTSVYSGDPTQMGLDEKTQAPVILPTLFPVLAWLLRLGVKDVRLFGVDMSGTASPIHSSEAWSPVSDEGHRWRWRVERVLLAHFTRLYRAKGARIERWNPRSRPSR